MEEETESFSLLRVGKACCNPSHVPPQPPRPRGRAEGDTVRKDFPKKEVGRPTCDAAGSAFEATEPGFRMTKPDCESSGRQITSLRRWVELRRPSDGRGQRTDPWPQYAFKVSMFNVSCNSH